MNDKNRNLMLRLASAIILLPLVLWLAAMGGWYCAVLLAVAAGICASEYYVIVSKGLRPEHMAGVAAAFAMPLYALWQPERFGTLAFWTLVLLYLFGAIFNLLRGPIASAPDRSAHLVTGALYAGAGLSALDAVRNLPHGVIWIVAAMVITWLNDTFAYFAGRFLGKHKLYPEVSPNKTWEGFFGGFVGSVGGLFIARAGFFPDLSPLDCVLLGLGGGVLGPLGDLSESMLKRTYGVKDSGKIIPGHGGLLDRVDALLFNGPLVFLYVTFLRGHL